jgi:hypothetical protein
VGERSNVHSIGLDENDSPNSGSTLDDLLEADMVLAIHPGTIFEDVDLSCWHWVRRLEDARWSMPNWPTVRRLR